MAKPVLAVAFLLSLLVFSVFISAASAESSSLGIKAGDDFIYGFTGFYQSNQTGAELPTSLQGQYDLTYIGAIILSVDGIAVTANSSYFYSNGVYMEIATIDYYGGYLPFFIPANLGVGDVVPNSGQEGAPADVCYVNDTTTQTFGSQSRTLLHLSIVLAVEGYSDVSTNAYWDQATGVLTQVEYAYSSQTGDTSTSWSITLKLAETNLFTISASESPVASQSPVPSPSVPEFSPAVIAVISIVLLIVATLYKKTQGSNAKPQNVPMNCL